MIDSTSTRVICLCDNLAPSGSGHWAEHGVAFYVEADGVRILFDTGQSGDVLLHNARLSGVSLEGLDAIVLSHGHYDHTGGLMKALEPGRGTAIVLHPAAFQKKIARKDGRLKDVSLPFTKDALGRLGRFHVDAGPVDLGSGVTTTGEVGRITSYEMHQPDLLTEIEGSLVPDPVLDDQSLVIRTNKGILLLCGCCHAGIVNTIECVKRQHGEYPEIIVGGLHMENARAERLSGTARALMAAGVKKVIAGHCSGDSIIALLASAGIDACRLASGMHLI